jgi:hypothetical protein
VYEILGSHANLNSGGRLLGQGVAQARGLDRSLGLIRGIYHEFLDLNYFHN